MKIQIKNIKSEIFQDDNSFVNAIQFAVNLAPAELPSFKQTLGASEPATYVSNLRYQIYDRIKKARKSEQLEVDLSQEEVDELKHCVSLQQKPVVANEFNRLLEYKPTEEKTKKAKV